ncbi:hypothetical protein L873DRAFT_1674692 [Choiromyces venosus 120613-1]|uniref:Rhodopsin domain-containing protein n=1 Tax=Choiromyces venosus 120613-1 TaxID=1336337 RepID=A0A3N4JU84_9PEZI|nr:hypothetical protein L873DRAFT_1674692 [Choiromyces venosus 120613-1]
MIGALAVFCVRVVVIHLVLVYDTNNVPDPGKLSDEVRHRRAFGSKMVLVGRTCYALFIWFMKFGIVSFYERIVARLEGYRTWLKYVWALLGVYPDPGEACTFSKAQLYTTGACNITTDLLIIIYPLPMIFNTHLPLRRKLQIGGLFSLGFFVILVSVFRLPFVVENNALQEWRTLFASIEMLVACFVANATALYRTIGARVHGVSDSRSLDKGAQGGYLFTANQRRVKGGGPPADEEEGGEEEGSEGVPSGGSLVCMFVSLPHRCVIYRIVANDGWDCVIFFPGECL